MPSGSFFRDASGEGVSTNMIDGPETSSETTAVRGVGLEVNLGKDPCCIDGALVARDEVENWEIELAMLRDFLAFLVYGITVSDAVAPE